MMVLGDIAVVVKDAKAAAQWWSEKVGFEIRDNADHWVTVASPGDDVVLHMCAGWAPPESGNTGIGFFATDVAAEERRLREKGVEFTMPTTTQAWGTMAMFKDPDGNEFAILQMPEAMLRSRLPRAKKAARKTSARKQTGAKRTAKKAVAKKGAKKTAVRKAVAKKTAAKRRR